MLIKRYHNHGDKTNVMQLCIYFFNIFLICTTRVVVIGTELVNDGHTNNDSIKNMSSTIVRGCNRFLLIQCLGRTAVCKSNTDPPFFMVIVVVVDINTNQCAFSRLS